MTAAATHEHLMAVMDEQIVCAESMLRTLEIESVALLQGDADSLDDVSAGKARLADTLDRLEGERRNLADALTVSRGTVNGNAARHKWERLLTVLEQCRDRNARNGSLVQARRAQLESALRAISGGQPASYDSTGNKRSQPGGHRLGSA